MPLNRPASASLPVASMASDPKTSLSGSEQGPYPRRGMVRWVRIVVLCCWSLILLYLGNAGFGVYQLVHDNLSLLLNLDKVRSALTLPGPLDSASTPLWADVVSGLSFLGLLAACVWATVDARKEAHHHL